MPNEKAFPDAFGGPTEPHQKSPYMVRDRWVEVGQLRPDTKGSKMGQNRPDTNLQILAKSHLIYIGIIRGPIPSLEVSRYSSGLPRLREGFTENSTA
jgi:hypothetical protein